MTKENFAKTQINQSIKNKQIKQTQNWKKIFGNCLPIGKKPTKSTTKKYFILHKTIIME